ncbi:MAG: hypothetical protein IKS35_00825 [Clostridia bacterium]|nr:hypothetical protein [Clostridia bacterium]
MCPVCGSCSDTNEKKTSQLGKALAITLGIVACISAVAYLAVKLYRRFCMIDRIDKDAIDNDAFLADEDSATAETPSESVETEDK